MSTFPYTHDPGTAPFTQAARDIFTSALAECTVERAFARKVVVEGTELRFDEEVFDLEGHDRVRILAVGKAASPMLTALLERLPLRAGCDVAGLLATPQAPAVLPQGFRYFPSGHPLPNLGSFQAAQAALEMLAALPRDAESVARTLCIFLISGGASAMMEAPLDATVSLADMAEFYRALVQSGASIVEINCVRKHFSAVKGGRLALAAPQGATRLAFLVSDVPRLHLAELGSGPVLPDPTTVEQCRAVLEHYALLEQFPVSVQRFFAQAHLPETPKPGAFPMGTCKLLDSEDLIIAAQARARALGFRVVVDNTCDDWEYMGAARYLLERLREQRQWVEVEQAGAEQASADPVDERPVCLLSAGEVTVRVQSPSGTGGRNQQFALYAATQIKPEDAPLAVLSAGSDGIDGNSPAAGAVVDAETLLCAAQLGLDAEAALAGFDAGTFFQVLGDAIQTGPTGNNLRDLRVLLASKLKAPPPAAKTSVRRSLSRKRKSARK
jgi:hydroxypyruvate reductase